MTENFRMIERLRHAIPNYVRGLSKGEIVRKLIFHLEDYYCNVASHEEQLEFLHEHEELPF